MAGNKRSSSLVNNRRLRVDVRMNCTLNLKYFCTKLKKLGLLLSVFSLVFSISSVDSFAATKPQWDDAYRSSEWDDQESGELCTSSTAADTQSKVTATPGKLFILGDSIGVGVNSAIPNYLKAEDGWSIEADVLQGRRLDQGITIAQAQPQGLKDAQNILIVLGTNEGASNTPSGVQEMVKALEVANSGASIFWLGRSDSQEGKESFNKVLSSSAQLSYIENTISPTAGDGVHYSDYGPLAELVAKAITTGEGSSIGGSSSSGGACVCNSVGSSVNVDKNLSLGSDAVERRIALMSLLMADFGLTAEQAAGIVGNFMQESGGAHLPPNINEGGQAGPPKFSGGYGWAQWTGSRQVEFIDFAIENGFMSSKDESATDAANYAWLKYELQNGYKETIEDLKKQSNPVDAAVSFHRTFEKSADNASQIGERGTSAQQAYAEYYAKAGLTILSGNGGITCGDGSATIVGDYAFPLITTKSGISNRSIFKDNSTDRAGHPYIAYDILVPSGTPTVAFLSGKVTHITQDKCPGQMISIYNQDSNLTISYLHLDFNNHVSEGDEVSVGGNVGLVGPGPNGCGTEHLHIDAVEGDKRPGCSREKCPVENQKFFRDIGPQLFETYQELPE